jgi:hypothetical protein
MTVVEIADAVGELANVPRWVAWRNEWRGKGEARSMEPGLDAQAVPRRVRLGPNRIAWREDEIEAWLAARSAARDGEAADIAGPARMIAGRAHDPSSAA